MKRPELKSYQTKAFHHYDMDAYAKDLDKYIDYLESRLDQRESGHQCPYCDHKSMQINDHFSHIEIFHQGKPLI